jgi:hypothetical protein
MGSFNYEILDNYRDIGKAIKMTDGAYEVIATLDVGPRIMHISLAGRENMLSDDCSLKEEMPDGRTWYSYGGHRLWHAPEKFPRSYVIDDEPLEKYEVLEDGVVLRQKEEDWTHIQKIIEVRLTGGRVRVTNTLVNKGAWAAEMAVWSQTSVSRECLLVCPATQRNTGLLPNTYYVNWPYSRMNDPRVYWGQRFVTVENNRTDPTAFKFGYPDELGWSAIFNFDMCMVKTFTHDRKGTYADMGCSFESYTRTGAWK